jgi:hypothetical protein
VVEAVQLLAAGKPKPLLVLPIADAYGFEAKVSSTPFF